MRHRLTLLGVTAAALLAGSILGIPGTPAPARAEALAPNPAMRTLAYGPDPLQQLDFYPPQDPKASRAPLVVFVHGGGWKRGSRTMDRGSLKQRHLTAQGYAFASLDYRLVPAARVEDQAADIATALRVLIDRAAALGIDPKRIVLMGHSAGAHLVALVGTDASYLKGAGLSPRDLAGIVPIDGAAYDVPAQMSDGPRIMQQTYRQAFGTDPARQRALSPTLQAAAPNAPRFLLLHVMRPDGARQGEALEKALRAGGTNVAREGFAGTGLAGHMEINRRLGDPGYAPTVALDGFLRTAFAR
ncbi:alpha/beta fold hydrolase [Novosphingobium sp. Gsoil 351]|nr:alpha/beta hydrolase [Novosphingobium sp. Gsoil 351]QGN56207.1 alpha/beta fold hydrolase [Novosphingobium sp. Gsoil 351]